MTTKNRLKDLTKDIKESIRDKNFYSFNEKEILEYFNTNKERGIDSSSIKKREELYGPNRLELEKEYTFFELYLIQAKSFLNMLILFLAIFAFIVWLETKKTEYMMDAIIIGVIFLINTLIGTYQNYNSRKIAKTLSEMLESKTIVLRDGKEKEINSTELVCGDIIILKNGDKVPADAYLIESSNLKVDESILTGESLAVFKKVGTIKKSVLINEVYNILFMNSFIVSGTATAVIIKTGKNTEIGKIAEKLTTKKKKITFIDEIDTASKVISKYAIFIIIIVSVILVLNGFNIIDIFLIASALIIGSVPEGLPMIVMFLLSKSIHKLSKEQILVKDIGLLETLGTINILCTDKTGTLTTNQMSVKRIFLNDKEYEVSESIVGSGSSENSSNLPKKELDIVRKITILASEIEILNNKVKGDPEDRAILKFCYNENIDTTDITKVKVNNELAKFTPFSSETKYISAKTKDGFEYTKGAIEIILKSASYYYKDSKVVKLTDQKKDQIKSVAKKFTDEALRIIAFSFTDEKDRVIFLGFAGLYDKPKDDIKDTVTELYKAHIDIKMITGDNVNTAKAIAKECGFKNIKAVEWKEIEDLSYEEFKKAVLTHNIFARVLPQSKQKIVETLQKEKKRVAISGDGVNDTIALRNADIGIVMGSGSTIAKESGDLILLNNNLSGLTKAVKEGRGIFHNIRKIVNYLLTANFAEVLTIFIASFLKIIPFTAIQILWVNFVTDVFPALALGTDKFPKNTMRREPTGKNEKILNNRIKLLTVFISLKKVALIFTIYYITFLKTHNEVLAQTVTFTWLVLTHFTRIAAIRFDEKMPLYTNRKVIESILFVLLLQVIILYTPLRKLFNILPIPPFFWGLLTCGVIIGIILSKVVSVFVDYLVKNYFQDKY